MYVATIQSNEIFSGSYRQKPIPAENVFSKKYLRKKKREYFQTENLEDTLSARVTLQEMLKEFFRQKCGNLDLPKETKSSRNDGCVGDMSDIFFY